MELRHLKYFIAVAEELSFRRAAARLHLAQPPLSAQIKTLEEELGVRLLERSTRSVRLTPAGGVLLEEARTLLASAERAAQNARNAGHGLVGVLRIGIVASMATARVAGGLRQFRQKFPGVQFSLHEYHSSGQLQRLRADELDVGFLRPPVGYAEMESQFVEEAPQVLALPAGHRLARERRIEWRDFHDESMVIIHPSLHQGYYDPFFDHCAQAGARPIVSQYAHDIHSMLWLISAGFGLAPTTRTIAEVKRPGLRFRELPPGLPLVQTMLVWKRANNSAILRNFLEFFPAVEVAGQGRRS